jgi:hypothetical protein
MYQKYTSFAPRFLSVLREDGVCERYAFEVGKGARSRIKMADWEFIEP